MRQRIAAAMRRAVAQGYREGHPAGDAVSAALPKKGIRSRHPAPLAYRNVAWLKES